MSQTLREFIKGAFGLVGLFLLLTHSTGFARNITAGTSGLGNDFKILQGR